MGDLREALQEVRDIGPERAEQLLRRPPARMAWKILGGLFAAAVLAFGTFQVVTTLAHEEYTIVEEFAARDIAVLDVSNDAGGVTVRASQRNSETITVTARVSHGLRRTGHRELVKGDRLVLESSCPVLGTQFCHVRYTVEVPTDIDVVVRSATGSLDLSGVTGDVDLSTDNGGIDVSRVEGDILRLDSDSGSVTATAVASRDVEATTDAGGVYVGFTRPPRTVRADSDAGGVEVVVPPDDAYDVEADSDSGGVDISVADDPRSDRKITATTEAGGVTVRYGVG